MTWKNQDLIDLLGPEVVLATKFGRQIVLCDLKALHSHRSSAAFFWQFLQRVLEPHADDPGPVLVPIDSGYRPGARNRASRRALLEQSAEQILGRIKQLPSQVDLILTSSGSTTVGGHVVGLSAAALRASAEATKQVLGGPGRWFLVLPTDHIAGFQVLARSLAHGFRPVLAFDRASFTGEELAHQLRQWRRLDGKQVPFFTSLVPLQLRRCLANPQVVDALRQCSAILVGGSAIDQSLLKAGRAEGLNLVTTYGMTETCGGCVYDGRPLPGTKIRLGEERQVFISTESMMCGYLEVGLEDGPAGIPPTWLQTNDLGSFIRCTREDGKPAPREIRADSEYRLEVLGRRDDIIISGGENVDLNQVLHALGQDERLSPTVNEVTAVGKDDPEWGQVVCLVVESEQEAAILGPRLRESLRGQLPGAALPRAVMVVPEMLRLPNGKIDRRGTQRLVRNWKRQTISPGIVADLWEYQSTGVK